MGFDAWITRTDGELAATGASARRGTVGDSLTSQETRVALLVARGQTNRDIATALFSARNRGAPHHHDPAQTRAPLPDRVGREHGRVRPPDRPMSGFPRRDRRAARRTVSR